LTALEAFYIDLSKKKPEMDFTNTLHEAVVGSGIILITVEVHKTLFTSR